MLAMFLVTMAVAFILGAVRLRLDGAIDMFGIEQQANPFMIASLMHVEAQTHVTLTLATAVVVVLIVFITAFLIGFSCGRIRPRRV